MALSSFEQIKILLIYMYSFLLHRQFLDFFKDTLVHEKPL